MTYKRLISICILLALISGALGGTISATILILISQTNTVTAIFSN